jgi:hypothetical protein
VIQESRDLRSTQNAAAYSACAEYDGRTPTRARAKR